MHYVDVAFQSTDLLFLHGYDLFKLRGFLIIGLVLLLDIFKERCFLVVQLSRSAVHSLHLKDELMALLLKLDELLVIQLTHHFQVLIFNLEPLKLLLE